MTSKRGRDDQFDDEDGSKRWALPEEIEKEKSDVFVWEAKREKLLKQGANLNELEIDQERKRAERLAEVEKIKQKRLERDREAEIFERERRKQDAEKNWSFKQWIDEERAFHMRQAKERAEIRLKEGRPKPIDIVHKNLEVDTRYDFDMRPPYVILAGLNLKQLQELESDLDMYLELSPQEVDFWKALQLLCTAQIDIATGKRTSVSKDVAEVFEGQTLEGLEELKANIAAQVEVGEDPEYWDALEKQCVLEIAKMTLQKIHAEKLQLRLAQMQDAQRATERARLEEKLRKNIQEEARPAAAQPAPVASAPAPAPAAAAPQVRRREKLVLEEVEEEIEEDQVDLDGGDQDAARIRQLAMEAQALEGQLGENLEAAAGAPWLSEQEMLRAEMERVGEADEEKFGDEIDVSGGNKNVRPGGVIDKYTPRKPLYFNRIKTGYEWNRYNSTHYSSDNPPPKVVQGYRFNIFYGELLDPSVTPRFTLEQIPGNHDWAILRFRAGPPYLDVAFKIVNRPWDKDPRAGYKALFDRGVLRVWFNFKRARYRR